ncbi:hypothetical protein [Atopococcus tabaci]|nr:hypothetical protein [Atopococcus tabaci]
MKAISKKGGVTDEKTDVCTDSMLLLPLLSNKGFFMLRTFISFV